MSAPARHEDRRSLLFMNYIHARLFKRSLLVLSVKVAFTLLLPWIRRHEDFYRFTRILCSCTLLPSYAKMPTLLPYPHPMPDLRIKQASSLVETTQVSKQAITCRMTSVLGQILSMSVTSFQNLDA